MANRSEIMEDLSKLVSDKAKLDAFAAKMDKQAEIANELNLMSKEEEVTEVAEENSLMDAIAEAFVPILEEVKALRKEVEEIKSGVAKSAGDSPAITLADRIKSYLDSGVTKSDAKQPDASQFKTPQLAKGYEDGDFFGAIANGAFDKPRKQ